MFSLLAITKRAPQILLALSAFVFFSLYCFAVTAEERDQQSFDEAARLDYINALGWMVDGNCSMEEVVIPQKFNDVYTEYNELQKEQGFDLLQYRGQTVKQYIYHVLNHESGSEYVYLHLLVFKDRVIGGDISSTELNGFMQPFK
ncbi:MAG: DUF4830 domain-containing protein [Clostridia bacterium]|nr:DUF4830 domain-containing protein [Clostridia bacterium]